MNDTNAGKVCEEHLALIEETSSSWKITFADQEHMLCFGWCWFRLQAAFTQRPPWSTSFTRKTIRFTILVYLWTGAEPPLWPPCSKLQFLSYFSWKEMPLLRRQTRGIFCIHINWKTFQTHTAALPQHQVRVKSARKLSIVTADRTGKLVLLTYSLTASLSVKSWNYQKRRLKLQTVHACMYAFYFRTSLKCILKYRLWCNSRSQ